jgi:hypothetical protein
MVFQHISPAREKVTIYSMVNGEAIRVPKYRVQDALGKTLDDGRYMFTARKEEAPVYKPGTTRCFLHAESPDRFILEEIGLAGKFCVAGSLANEHSKRVHAQHRHRQEWEAFQEYLAGQEKAIERAERREQLEATLSIARGATGQKASAPDSDPSPCDECDFVAKNDFGLNAHKRNRHGIT